MGENTCINCSRYYGFVSEVYCHYDDMTCIDCCNHEVCWDWYKSRPHVSSGNVY